MFYLIHVLQALWEILAYLYKQYVLRIPVLLASIGLCVFALCFLVQVSYPGDAIEKRQKRCGKWSSVSKVSKSTGWTFSSGFESHKISELQTPNHRLTGESAGRQIWYKTESSNRDGDEETAEFCASVNPNSSDKIFRKLMLDKWQGEHPDPNQMPTNAREASIKALSFYQMLQCDEGHWAGDYGGPMFLMPGLICTLYITKVPFPLGRKEGMIQYLRNHQQLDGGWGTHIECASTMFGTVLSYVALRLLGEEPEQEHMCAARQFIHHYGGALFAPSWAKFWLAVIGVYDWDGINSIPAEMWFLPRWFPFHPGKLWCHCRMVYLPMCYLYSKRYTPDVASDKTLLALRTELYVQSYDSIDWNAYRQSCADIDQYSPLNPIMKVAQDFMVVYERYLPFLPPLVYLRKRAMSFVMTYIHAEDEQTNFIDIGPVNKALNMLAVYVEAGSDASCEHFQRHIARVDDYLWVAEDGVKMQGYNGSQCWDTSFAVQAIIEGGMAKQFPECVSKIYSYLEKTQIADNVVDRGYFFRHISKGGWPFSTAAHGWPISDCTAEGLKAVLALHNDKSSDFARSGRISDDRLFDACNILLSYQSGDNGWSSYEINRGYRWYEMLNPSEVFGDVMIDYSYVECSSACITALKSFAAAFPTHRRREIQTAISTGAEFIKSIQRPDGSWYGSWGNCFTYGTWFGIEGLVAAGVPLDASEILRAVEFLKGKQNPNGGWGESYLACVNKEYPTNGTGEDLGEDGSGVVQTAWAVLGLLMAGCGDHDSVRRGVAFLMRKQLASGDWAQEGITGVFNRSCGITYTAYRNIFPMWALARYANWEERTMQVHK